MTVDEVKKQLKICRGTARPPWRSLTRQNITTMKSHAVPQADCSSAGRKELTGRCAGEAGPGRPAHIGTEVHGGPEEEGVPAVGRRGKRSRTR